MILYDSSLDMNFRKYGIMLPILDSRAGRIIKEVQNSPVRTNSQATKVFPVYTLNEARQEIGRTAGETPEPIGREDIERVHEPNFVSHLFDDTSKGLEKELLTTYELIDQNGEYNRYEPGQAERPLSDLFGTIRQQVEGTYLACRLALEQESGRGFCFYLGGGMHHARYDSGSGFCLINDSIISIRRLQSEGQAALVWIIDVDAHKGDGSAELVTFSRSKETTFLDKNPSILTLSVHMAKGWPLDAETLSVSDADRAPNLPSDIDIPMEENEEDLYLPRLKEGLKQLQELSGNRKPDLAIVVDGADPYEHDGLASSGLLKLSLEQCVARDRYIYSFLQENAVPSAWLMAGGYGDRAWEPPAAFLQQLAKERADQ
ncbi:MAG: histone deacetylase [Spirochaetaceae bacterium]|jgi:acetoin utilization deacetylase AcuC-like enzyme|nr:histone deacetylase [Spirochaetaceae bacterium]